MASTSLIPSKRPREVSNESLSPPLPAPANSQRFRNSIVLAPMVRSGTMPTRLLALKYGASLVWGPEIVDKAMLHAKRVVNEKTGVVSFEGITSSIWSCHPAERPYLIYQIGSSTPSLAVAAALLVSRDVSGVDLNCGCPKPFSTSGGMGAALLDTPDLLCEILTSLRKALPAHISVSCKIRLLPDREKTLDLVRKIVRTGISCLTVHCRTRSMRNSQPAVIERLKEVVECVRGMKDDNGKPLDVAVLCNGDVEGLRDMQRVRETTGADGVMVATKAEENPSCFAENMASAEELILDYLRIAKYLDNGFGNTKHCISSFRPPPGVANQKSALKAIRAAIAPAKDMAGLEPFVRSFHKDEEGRFDNDTWGGDKLVQEIVQSIKSRPTPVWWDGVEAWEASNPLQADGMDIDLGEEGIKQLLEKEREERPRKKSKVEKDDANPALLISNPIQRTETPLFTTTPEVAILGTPGPVCGLGTLMEVGREKRSPSPERGRARATMVG